MKPIVLGFLLMAMAVPIAGCSDDTVDPAIPPDAGLRDAKTDGAVKADGSASESGIAVLTDGASLDVVADEGRMDAADAGIEDARMVESGEAD